MNVVISMRTTLTRTERVISCIELRYTPFQGHVHSLRIQVTFSLMAQFSLGIPPPLSYVNKLVVPISLLHIIYRHLRLAS